MMKIKEYPQTTPDPNSMIDGDALIVKSKTKLKQVWHRYRSNFNSYSITNGGEQVYSSYSENDCLPVWVNGHDMNKIFKEQYGA